VNVKALIGGVVFFFIVELTLEISVAVTTVDVKEEHRVDDVIEMMLTVVYCSVFGLTAVILFIWTVYWRMMMKP